MTSRSPEQFRSLRKIESTTCEWYDVKVRGILGSGRRDVQEVEILGTTLRCTEQGLEYQAGDKHRQAFLRGLGLNDDSKTVNIEAMKEEELRQDEDEEILGAEEARQLTSLAATLNHMCVGRSVMQYAAKKVCRKMANPTRRSWNAGR